MSKARKAVCALAFTVGISAQVATSQTPALRVFARSILAGFGYIPQGLTDLDRDGGADINGAGCVPQCRGQAELRNAGNGTFRCICHYAGAFASSYAAGGAPAVGDIDRDGYDDLVIGNLSWYNNWGHYFWFGDGKGNLRLDTQWNRTPIPPFPEGAGVPLLFDADSDGDLDIYAWGAPGRLYLNDGKGFFAEVTSTHLPYFQMATVQVVSGDLDGDRDIDIAVAGASLNYPQPGPRPILINDGKGKFQLGQTLTMIRGEGVAIGDVDGDGDLDLLYSLTGPILLELYLNDGKASFSNATHQLPGWKGPPAFGMKHELVDIDRDGDLDIVGMPSDPKIAPGRGIFLNDGKGWFTDVSAQALLPPDTAGGDMQNLVADFDGDGDMDIVLHRYSNTQYGVILWNVQRQVETPIEVRPGDPFPLELWADQGHVMLPYAGPKAVDWRIPLLGRWAVDPALALGLPPQVMPSTRTVTLNYTIPNDPGFVGITIYTQAIDIWGQGLRATSWVETKVVR